MVVEICLFAGYRVLIMLGSDYGLNNNHNFNTRLEYDLYPVFVGNGFMYDGRIYLSKHGERRTMPVDDIPVVDENNAIMGMSGYLWDGEKLYVVIESNGWIDYYQPELQYDKNAAEEVIVFKKMPAMSPPQFNQAIYRRTKDINRLCYHIIYIKRASLVIMITLMILIVPLLGLGTYKHFRSVKTNEVLQDNRNR